MTIRPVYVFIYMSVRCYFLLAQLDDRRVESNFAVTHPTTKQRKTETNRQASTPG
jgi:hypothetical protein